MPKKLTAKITTGGDKRALVIGVSEYPDPQDRLPAVAADLREMAKILSSKRGVFPRETVKVLADKFATRDKVISALRGAFGAAGDTVFVYMAGHGTVIGGKCYFLAFDSTDESTAIPLSEIKTLFDACKSRRTLLWLDFCHSGGILARGTVADIEVVRRSLDVVSGAGKAIIAACTSTQSSYESAILGHGFFTHALIRGLKGEAVSTQGNITDQSLYAFIHDQVADHRQQPVYFGVIEAPIVLMHSAGRTAGAAGAAKIIKAKPKPKSAKTTADTWLMLGDRFFRAESVRNEGGGKLEVRAVTANGVEAAVLAEIRAESTRASSDQPFAYDTEAHVVRVRKVESEATGDVRTWVLQLTVDDSGFGAGLMGSYTVGDQRLTQEDVAERRARRILLDDPPRRDRSGYPSSVEDSIQSWVEGTGRYMVRECVIRSVFASRYPDPNWRSYARLKAVFMLKVAGVVEHVHELKIGPVRKGQVTVEFTGRRRTRFDGDVGTPVSVKGTCCLNPAPAK